MQPFVLTTTEIPDYDIQLPGHGEGGRDRLLRVLGEAEEDGHQGKRYFEGQIWVDDRDLQIVKTYGKGVGELKKGSSKNQRSRNSRPTASRSTANIGSRPTPMPTTRCTSRTATTCGCG